MADGPDGGTAPTQPGGTRQGAAGPPGGVAVAPTQYEETGRTDVAGTASPREATPPPADGAGGEEGIGVSAESPGADWGDQDQHPDPTDLAPDRPAKVKPADGADGPEGAAAGGGVKVEQEARADGCAESDEPGGSCRAEGSEDGVKWEDFVGGPAGLAPGVGEIEERLPQIDASRSDYTYRMHWKLPKIGRAHV